jgi:hypothetical protein
MPKDKLSFAQIASIPDSAFKGHRSINIHAPKAVSIGWAAFEKVKNFKFCADQVQTVGQNAFDDCESAYISLNGLQGFTSSSVFNGSTVHSLELLSLVSTDYYNCNHGENSSITWPKKLHAIKIKMLSSLSERAVRAWQEYGDTFIIFAYDQCKHLFEDKDNVLKAAYERGREVYNLLSFSVGDTPVDANKALDLMLENASGGCFKSHAVNPPEAVTLCTSENGSLMLRKRGMGSVFQLDQYTGSICTQVENLEDLKGLRV